MARKKKPPTFYSITLPHARINRDTCHIVNFEFGGCKYKINNMTQFYSVTFTTLLLFSMCINFAKNIDLYLRGRPVQYN